MANAWKRHNPSNHLPPRSLIFLFSTCSIIIVLFLLTSRPSNPNSLTSPNPQFPIQTALVKLVGRLDNSAVSAAGAKLAFKSNEEIELQVKSIPLDDVTPEPEPVLVLQIDVQGWEYHVLKGATKLLSRNENEAPYLIYEEDERLLQASNSSAKEIQDFLSTVGYHHCTQHGTDAHCTKKES